VNGHDMADLDGLFLRNRDRLEDFWGRRQNRPRFDRTVSVFDRQVELTSNDDGVLGAVDHCLPLYSTAPATDRPSFAVQLVVRAGPSDPGPPPENLPNFVQFTGDAAWLTIALGAWGHCYVDLSQGRAVAVLSPQLVRRTDLVSLCLLNTILTNFFIGSGYAMLHASCLWRAGRALLLMAPHNSGKSTTALRLALAGYPLVCDSMIFLSPYSRSLQLLGFPVGKIKLRRDMLPAFAHLRDWVSSEATGTEIKYGVDLRRVDPALVHQTAVTPSAIDLCLLTRAPGEETFLTPANRADIGGAVVMNSLFFDAEPVWRRNLDLIERLLDRARLHHLAVGSDAGGIVAAVDSLWAG
jgi:hypothetical protein